MPSRFEDGEAAQASHLDGEPRPDDAVHRGGDDRDLEAPPGQFPGDVDLVRVDRQRSGNEAISSNPYAALALRPRPTHMPIVGIPLPSGTG